MKISEKQLREMVKNTISSILKESQNNDDIEIDDTWYQPDEFDSEEIGEPTEIGDDDIVLNPEEKPENLTKAHDRRQRAAELIRSILAKQGLSGDKLEREVEKRVNVDKPDASTRRMDRMYDAGDTTYINGKNMYIPAGGIYDDDTELYECVRNAVKRVLSEK